MSPGNHAIHCVSMSLTPAKFAGKTSGWTSLFEIVLSLLKQLRDNRPTEFTESLLGISSMKVPEQSLTGEVLWLPFVRPKSLRVLSWI